MDSQRILTSALEAIHRTMIKASESDELPALNLYQPLDADSRSTPVSEGADSNVLMLNELAADDAQEEKSEPGLQSSIRHGDKHVSTATSERGRPVEAGSGQEQKAAEDWFGDIAWSKDGSNPSADEEPISRGVDEKSSSGPSGQSTEEFFTGVNWDADSSDDQNAADLHMLDESKSTPTTDGGAGDDATNFFESTNWDGGAGANSERGSAPSEGSSEEDAETFLGEMAWDGRGQSLSVDPTGDPPEHVKNIAEDDRGGSVPPATEDAVDRSNDAESVDKRDSKE